MNNATQPLPSPWWKRGWFLGLLLLAATFIAYQPAWRGEAVYDDTDHLTSPELSSAGGLARIWTELGVVSQYYPVTHTAFWLQNKQWGDAMLGYHLTNILLHGLCALLLARILVRLGVRGAWLAAAVFALHPVHVESVAWISELKNTLSGVCYLGAALAYLDFDETGRRNRYLAALALFAAGLLAKGVIASLPAALLVVFWWKRGTLSWRQDVWPLVPFFVLGIAGGLLTAWVERRFIGAHGAAFALTAVERGLIAGRAVWFYFWKLVWPADLVFIYPRWQVSQAVWWQYLFPLTAVAVAAALWLARGRWRGPLAALLFFVGTLAPALGFLNVYPFIYSFVADHYQYLASIGVIVALCSAAAWLLARWGLWGRPAGHALCLALLVLLGGMSWRQSGMYAGVETLWQTTIARNPAAWVAHSNLGNYYFQLGRLDDAIAYCRNAIALRPETAEVHNNLGNALRDKGRIDEALNEYRRALELRPTLAEAHHNIGNVLLERGQVEEAIARFHQAVELRPDFVNARVNLGSLLLDQGRVDEAIVHLRKALEILPDHPAARVNLGNALLRKGWPDQAIAQYQIVLARQPNDANAEINYGVALLQKGQGGEALSHMEKAIKLQPQFVQAHSVLGHALLQQGRVADAVRAFAAAVQLAPDSASARNDLGNALLGAGQPDEAAVQFRRAVEIQPDLELAHYNLGQAALRRGAFGEAVPHFRKALSLQPRFLEAHYFLAHALLQQGQVDEAVVHLRTAVELEPNFAEAHHELGTALLQQGRVNEGLASYRLAAKLQPDNPIVLSSLAWILATWPDASVRNAGEAVQLAERANELLRGQDPFVLRGLAAAYAEAGRYDEAVNAVRRAVPLASSASDSALLQSLNAQLARYQEGMPSRQLATGTAPTAP